MTTKTKYMLPAMVAIFALMFVAVTPYVVAEEGERSFAQHDMPFKHKKTHANPSRRIRGKYTDN